MTSTSFACSLCSGVFQVDTQQTASQVYCPHCGEVVDLPKEYFSETGSELPAATQESTSNRTTRVRKRSSRKKSPPPGTLNNADLFPPGHVPKSPPEGISDNDTSATSPIAELPGPVDSPQVSDAVPASKEDPQPAAESPTAQLPQPTSTKSINSPSNRQPLESLLPPTVGTALPNQDSRSPTSPHGTPSTTKPTTAEHLLPPSVAASGTSSSGDTPLTGISFPDSTETGAYSPEFDSNRPQIALLDPVKTVQKGDHEIELKQRTPEEKLQWKWRKNLVMWIGGILILVITLFVMKH